MGRFLDLTGEVFGHWTVLRVSGKRNGGYCWKVHCDCGIEREVTGSNLTNGSSSSCGCARKPDLTGRKFGKLLVLERAGFIGGYRAWKVHCDCGTEKIVTGTGLLSGTKSCGCARIEGAMKARGQKDLLPLGEAAFRHLKQDYQCNAFERNLGWEISDEYLRWVIHQPCFYCGDPPANRICKKSGDLVYSGLDRRNSEGDYEENNVVPCCRRCNFMKWRMSVEEFLVQIQKIAARQNTTSQPIVEPMTTMEPRL